MVLLVTGGAGFIGKHLVTDALKRRAQIIVMDKKTRPQSFLHSNRLVYRQADAGSIGKVLRLNGGRDFKIVHLAAETSVRDSVLRPLSSVETNVGVTCAVLEFARKVDARGFVFASTAAVYGDRKGACHEDDLPNPRSPYAASKLSAEHYCKVYAALYGLPIVILRYFNVYGPGQSATYAGVIASFLREVSAGRRPTIFGDGTQTRDFIFVDDVVRATLASMTEKLTPGTILNIGTGQAMSINRLAKRVLELFEKRNLEPQYEPAREGDVGFSKADVSMARKEIGFRPTYDVSEGLRMTVNSIVNC